MLRWYCGPLGPPRGSELAIRLPILTTHMTVPEPTPGAARAQTPMALALLVSALAWAWRLTLDPAPWDAGSGGLLASGVLLVHAVLAIAGLLAMSRWIAVSTTAALALELTFALVLPTDVGWWIGVIGITAAAALAWGRASMFASNAVARSDRVPTAATALTLVLLATPIVIGLVSWQGVTTAGWVLAGASVLLAWAYMRALVWSLWFVRTGYAAGVIWALASQSWPEAVVIALWGGIAIALAWTSTALAAANPLHPERAQPVPILPEVVPSELLESAGFDAKGRPRLGLDTRPPQPTRPTRPPASSDTEEG